MNKLARVQVDITEQQHKKEPKVASRSKRLPKHDAEGTRIGLVTYRCGTRMSHNYHSVTCEVEVTLPVALEGAFGEDEYDADVVKAAAAEAVDIAETVYEQESKGLKKLLRQMSKE